MSAAVLEEERLLTTADLATRWQLDEVSLRRWRAAGKGPKSIKIGAAVRYRPADITKFEEDNLG